MKIELKPIDSIVPYIRNPRKNEKAIPKVKASIKEFGFRQPIVVDKDNVIVVGHTRWLAAKELGMNEVPVHIADSLTDAQIKSYRITDNRTNEEAEWDEQLLAIELGELKELNVDLGITGFSELEIDNFFANDLLKESEGDTEPQVDRAEELREKWGVETGDLWLLGEHRLLCGDSTKAEDVARVMGGEKADLCFTSPPYGQQRDYRDGATEKVSDWDSLMQGVFANLPMSDAGQVLVNLGLIHRDNEWIPYWDGWIQWMRQQGWRRFGWYVWDQVDGMPGDWGGRFAPAFEFVFHFNKESMKPEKTIPCKWAGRQRGGDSGQRGADGVLKTYSHAGKPVQEVKIQDSIIRAYRDRIAGLDHPAVMSLELCSQIVSAWPGLVYEPFSGSGTTIIACQNLKRKARAIEISPAYVAVALERFFQHTNIEPQLIGKSHA